MSRILAIADVHIHDYPQRNPSEKFRLYQTRQVAQNIIEVGQREGAEILVIAGDILEKSIIRPYVQAEVKMFLDTVVSAFKVGYIIWEIMIRIIKVLYKNLQTLVYLLCYLKIYIMRIRKK